MNNVYSLRDNTIVFHNKFDKLNEFSIYLYDPIVKQLLRLTKEAYFILYYLRDHKDSNLSDIVGGLELVSNEIALEAISDGNVKNIINTFVKKNIILEKMIVIKNKRKGGVDL